MLEAEFLPIADIPEAPGGFALAASSVSSDGTGLFLYVEADKVDGVFGTYTDQGGATFPNTKTPESVVGRLIEISDGTSIETPLNGIDVTFPFVDRFPDGRILVAGRRASRYEDGTFDLNGLVFTPDGELDRRFALGDGIEQVSCDGLGRIWVSYFDEGVFGNYGWGNEPIGGHGLVCFGADGTILWEFEATNHRGDARYISDCYALNVKDDQAWAFYYADFDICAIDRDFKPSVYGTALEGCHGLAVLGSQVLLPSQYTDPPDAGYLGTLADGRLQDVQKVRMLFPDTYRVERPHLHGRGSTLNLFHEDRWYQYDMALHSG